jgi:pSer/pThr/pTyr-binding forkhead associated (FHA) protein
MDANLVLLKKNGSHKTFALPSKVTVIGRREDCDLRVPLPTVSRRHCQLRLNQNSVELRDLESRCGTFVNNKRVATAIAVKAGDYIRIGPLTFVCQIDGKPEKIVPPPKAAPPAAKAKPKPTPPKPAAKGPADSGSKLDEDLSDLDVSGSFLSLDESDSDLEDLRNL